LIDQLLDKVNMEAGHWKQDIWDTIKAIFWGLTIFGIIINALNVIIGVNSLGIYFHLFFNWTCMVHCNKQFKNWIFTRCSIDGLFALYF